MGARRSWDAVIRTMGVCNKQSLVNKRNIKEVNWHLKRDEAKRRWRPERASHRPLASPAEANETPAQASRRRSASSPLRSRNSSCSNYRSVNYKSGRWLARGPVTEFSSLFFFCVCFQSESDPGNECDYVV